MRCFYMEQKFYSIKEFAELLDISQQSIYKRLKKENDPIHKHTKIEDNKTLISESAIGEVFKRSIPLQDNNTKQVEEKRDNTTQETIEILKDQIQTLKNIIESKDKEVERLTAQIDRLTRLLEEQQASIERQQKLSILDKQNILMLEETVQKKKKKRFFSWFNKKEEDNNEVVAEVVNENDKHN